MNEYRHLQIRRSGGVAFATIDNGPVNVLDVSLMSELRKFLVAARGDDGLKVIVFESANPDFFIAHVDMTLIDQPHAFDEMAKEAPDGMNVFQAFAELVRHQPQVTIVKLAGIARGGGAEFVTAADMTFAAVGKAGLAQCEALMGIVPGGGGTQYALHRLGRNRALEVVLGAELFSAELAERYGWINRALPSDQLDTFVDTIAHNIATLPEGVIAAAKQVLSPAPLRDGFLREHEAWYSLFIQPAAEALIRGGLEVGAQTVEGELHLEQLLRELGRRSEGRKVSETI